MKTVIEMARKSKLDIYGLGCPHDKFIECVEAFAELVRADEREACARVCEAEASRAKWNWDNDISGNQPFWNGGEQLASSCAAAIRARGQA